jgi:hypothetical protein
MANRLNLAMLNKKKEEVSKSEMNKAKGGTVQLNREETCECNHVWIDNTFDVNIAVQTSACRCSIWMILGLMLGVSEE